MNSFEDSILRVLKGDTVVGAAFLVSDRLVATCAHVVESAGVKVGGKVSLRLADGKQIEGIVEPEFWSDTNAEDIAILRLENPLENIQPRILGSSSGIKGHNFSTFGFPNNRQELSGGGKIIGQATIDGIKVLQLRSPEVTPGFSGAPIFDENTKRVVGMVVAITPPDEYQRLGTTAFAISSENLREICSELQISDICPYRSLDVFNEEDAPFFFGRERFVQKMVDSLKREPRFLAVLGPSGSGKSSVVRAGLIPELKQGKVPGSDRWGIITIRPANQPFEQLDSAGLSRSQDRLEKAVRAWLEDHPEKTRLVLIIDQFEELLVSTSENLRQKFIRELVDLLDSSVEIAVVVTMRDDFYSHFTSDAALLTPWLEKELLNIPSTLDEGELQSIIKTPAEKSGCVFEDGLVDAIVFDVIMADRSKEKAQSTALPLLEFALTQLWEKREDGRLSHTAYHAIGKVTGGLAQWADRAYYSLTDEEREQARRIFINLIYIGDETLGIPYIRRVREISELLHHDEVVTRIVINHLVKVRLLSTGRNAKTHQETVELIHEALIREWGKLRKWLEDDRAFLAWRERLYINLTAWEQNNHDVGAVLHGILLSEAEGWLEIRGSDLSENEASFIKLGLSLREREIFEREAQQQREQENKRQINKLQNLRSNIEELSTVLSGARDMRNLLDQVVNKMSEIIGAQGSSLYLVDEARNRLVIQAAAGYQKPLVEKHAEYVLGEGVTGSIAKSGQRVRANSVEELRSSPAWVGKQNPLQSMREPNSFLGVPLKVRDRFTGKEKIIGVLKMEDIVDTEEHPEDIFTDQDELLVRIMANIIATVVYNTQVVGAQLADLGSSLGELSNALAGGREINQLLDQVIETTARVLHAHASSLYLIDETSGKLIIKAATGYQKPLVEKRAEYVFNEGITGTIARLGNTVRANNIHELHQSPGWVGKYNSVQAKREPNAFLGLPLKVRDRITSKEKIIGVLKVEDVYPSQNHPEDYFTDMDVQLGTMIANIIGSFIYNLRFSQSE